MGKKLFLLDGMGMIYRAHFALINRPIFTSKGLNTSALYGFTQSLLQILREQQPTHIAVAMDTGAPTHRLADFEHYKAERQEMPEDIALAIPNVYRMLDAFNIRALTCDGYEADDIVGTLVRRAEKEGFTSYMATLDKDFGQLVSEKTFLYKLSRMGDAVEVLGVPEVLKKWEIKKPEQVVDVMALWGDTSDNIPGVPGIGEKTAKKLIGEYGTLENLLAHTGELKGKLKETLEKNREQAVMSKRLATLICDAPCEVDFEELKVQKHDDEKLKAMFIEFEFNSIGRRIFGESFHAGRTFQGPGKPAEPQEKPAPKTGDLFEHAALYAPKVEAPPVPQNLKTISDVAHRYTVVTEARERAEVIKSLLKQKAIAVKAVATGTDVKKARLLGVAFSHEAHTGVYLPLPADAVGAKRMLEELRPVFESEEIEKLGQNLKYHLGLLKWNGITVRGKLFDTMIAHALIEPDLRHALGYMAEVYLGYTPIPIERFIGEKGEKSLADAPVEAVAEYAAEEADVVWQLRPTMEKLLKQKGQERVFYEIEAPLVSVLVDMEFEGVKVDSPALAEFGAQLTKEIAQLEKTICQAAGKEFNLNSARQLGEVLFDILKICENPKKTRTGQYATDEQTLLALRR